MTAPVFVDTNVLICARDPGEVARQQRAQAWLTHLWRDALGRTSMQVLSEFYVTVTRRLAVPVSPESAWQELSTFLAWRPQPIDDALMRRAWDIEQRHLLSWSDSMVVGAAQLQGCAVLLTEDLQDGASYGDLTVRSPFTLEVREPAAAYVVTPVASPRHRPRGRPKRGIPRERLAEVCRKYRVKKLSLFGSAARNELVPESDIDLIVEFEPGSATSLWDMPAMRRDLSALFDDRPVDLVPPEVLENPFRRRAILPELRVLYESR